MRYRVGRTGGSGQGFDGGPHAPEAVGVENGVKWWDLQLLRFSTWLNRPESTAESNKPKVLP